MNLKPFVDEIMADVLSELGTRFSPETAAALNDSDVTAFEAAIEKAAARGLIRGAIEAHDATTAQAAKLFNCPELVSGMKVKNVEIPDRWADEYGADHD